MTTKLLRISCPEYKFDILDLQKVSVCIDTALADAFTGKNIVLRGVQSEKHDLTKEQLVKKIISFGSDRFQKKAHTHEMLTINILIYSDLAVKLRGLYQLVF